VTTPRTGEPEDDLAETDLLPPGPMATIDITPQPCKVECRGTRRVRVRATDAARRIITTGLAYAWEISGDIGTLNVAERHRATATLEAAARPGRGQIHVRVTQDSVMLAADTTVDVVERLDTAHPGEGIPTPAFVHEPGAAWRSRMLAGRWQVNTAHQEYQAVQGRQALKLRYLAMLFAKEIILRSHQDPRLETPLEQLVEVAGYADRNLSLGRRKRGAAESGA